MLDFSRSSVIYWSGGFEGQCRAQVEMPRVNLDIKKKVSGRLKFMHCELYVHVHVHVHPCTMYQWPMRCVNVPMADAIIVKLAFDNYCQD